MQETILNINETYHNFIMPDIGCKKKCSGKTALYYKRLIYIIIVFFLLLTFRILAFVFQFQPFVIPVFLNFPLCPGRVLFFSFAG